MRRRAAILVAGALDGRGVTASSFSPGAGEPSHGRDCTIGSVEVRRAGRRVAGRDRLNRQELSVSSLPSGEVTFLFGA
jgi:hypothetical protein